MPCIVTFYKFNAFAFWVLRCLQALLEIQEHQIANIVIGHLVGRYVVSLSVAKRDSVVLSGRGHVFILVRKVATRQVILAESRVPCAGVNLNR